MKKYFIALLFGMSLMSMQTASAATLALSSFLAGSNVDTAGPGSTIGGSSAATPIIPGFPLVTSAWTLTVSDATDVTFSFSGVPSAATFLTDLSSTFQSFSTTTFTTGVLAAGSYILAVLTAPNVPFSFTATVIPPTVVTPIPAAIWLFGSALLGLIGVSGRKSKTALAA